MKINPFFLLVTLMLAALISYTAMVYCQNSFKLLFTILSGVGSLSYLLFLLAINFENTRTTINIKTLSVFFMAINIGLLIYFVGVNRTESSFVIVYSLLLLIYTSIVYSIAKVKA
jgi:hypothetical protein